METDSSEVPGELPDSPDKSKTRDQRIRQRIVAALTAKRKQPTLQCAMCGASDWLVGFYSPIPIAGSPVNMSVLGKRIYPMVTIICKNCGNTHFVNLFILGFTSDDVKEMALELPEDAPEPPDA